MPAACIKMNELQLARELAFLKLVNTELDCKICQFTFTSLQDYWL
jgi:hypothetical protein